MFKHMQKLPIGYFDGHSDGDMMSHFTNDTDTLRQMISQSIPNLMMAAVTFCSVFIAMFSISIPLTCFVLVSVILMLNVIRSSPAKAAASLAHNNGSRRSQWLY